MRTLLSGMVLSLALAGLASGDALILKDGRKLSGRVVEKPDGYEINVEGQTLGFAKEEVERWVKSPKELTGEADKLYAEAKDIYSKAVEIADEKAAEAKMREALPKVTKAREGYAEARDLFPDGYDDLDKQLVNVMKLMRLVRERLGSQIASAPGAASTGVVKVRDAPPPKPAETARPVDPEPAAAPSSSMAEALAVVVDPARRADPVQRSAAKALFRKTVDDRHPLSDVAMAGFLFLSRDDYDWGLVADEVTVKGSVSGTFRGRLLQKSDDLQALVGPDGRELRIRKTAAGFRVAPPGGSEVPASEVKVVPSQRSAAYEALQAYFKGIDAAGYESLPEKEIAEGVTFLALKVKELRGKGEDVEALSLFVAGPASALILKHKGKPSKVLEAAFKDLGFEQSEYGPVWGTKPGLAMDDYRKWVSSGEYGLAIVQFQNDYRSVIEFPVKYALGLLHVFKALADNRAYARAASFLEITSRTAPTPSAREHLLALAKTIRSESPCMACAGTHEVNCTACKGKKKLTLQCGRCGGSGKINSLRGIVNCVGCKAQGYFRNVDCPKCKAKGTTECKARGCDKPVKPPTFETFADAFQCALCKGQGSLLRHVAYPCPECAGIGLIVQPKSDPSKLLK